MDAGRAGAGRRRRAGASRRGRSLKVSRVAVTERSRDWSERAVAWVERSCAEQGVPVKLSDPVALRRIADILGEAREAREKGTRKGRQAG
jgi:hypothetical protein